MCAAPQNNKELTNEPKYLGVGGHLFAIGIDKELITPIPFWSDLL